MEYQNNGLLLLVLRHVSGGPKHPALQLVLVTLCDHNSRMVLGADSEGMKESKLKTQNEE